MPLHNTLRTDLSKLTFLQFRYNERRSDLVKICSMVHITLRPGENHEQKRARRFPPLEGLSMWLWQARRKGNRRPHRHNDSADICLAKGTNCIPKSQPDNPSPISWLFKLSTSDPPGAFRWKHNPLSSSSFFLCHTCLHYHTLGCWTLHDRDPTVCFLYLASLCSNLYSQMTSTSPMVLNAIYACMALKFTSATHLCPLSSSLLSPNLMMIPLGCTMCVSNCI